MSLPDPDKDLLDKLDRRERLKIIRPALIAILAGAAAGGAAYAVMKLVMQWAAPAPLDGALVVFIVVVIWLFAILSKGL